MLVLLEILLVIHNSIILSYKDSYYAFLISNLFNLGSVYTFLTVYSEISCYAVNMNHWLFGEYFFFSVLWNPESLQNIDKTSMKESVVHFRLKSYYGVLWQPTRFA